MCPLIRVSVWFIGSQQDSFLQGSQYLLIWRADAGLFPWHSVASLLSFFCSFFPRPSLAPVISGQLPPRKMVSVAGGHVVVCFIKHDPSAQSMRRFTRTVHAFILMVLGGTRGKQIDSEKALTASGS